MCHAKTPNIDPFNPLRDDLVPLVLRAVTILRERHRAGQRELPKDIGRRSPARGVAVCALALRHLDISEGGECVDVTRRVRGRRSPPLMKRVAKRLHTSVPRVRALCALVMIPNLPDAVWDQIDQGVAPEQIWREVLRHEGPIEKAVEVFLPKVFADDIVHRLSRRSRMRGGRRGEAIKDRSGHRDRAPASCH
jgi:hypothetical protein